METRSFVGKNMDEALRAVRASLGPDARILQTRQVAAGNGTGVEVTALPEEVQKGKPASTVAAQQIKNVNPVRDLCPTKEPGEQHALHQLRNLLLGEHDQEPEAAGELRKLRQELTEIKSLFRWFAPCIGRGTVVEELLAKGLSSETLTRIMQELPPQGGVDRVRVRQALARLIPIGGDMEFKSEKQTCLALIGPTGVGKTTTIVKLTARLARRSERRIGWVSLDNRRIAGSEQLVVYAGILGVPCEVVEGKESLSRALNRLSSCDLVLIDTPGTSPRDTEGLAELARFMRDVPAITRTLLLSATTNSHDMADWVTLYQKVGFDSLLFTKLDEGTHLGGLINIALTSGHPLSYLTRGQSITNSLELVKGDTLPQLLLP